MSSRHSILFIWILCFFIISTSSVTWSTNQDFKSNKYLDADFESETDIDTGIDTTADTSSSGLKIDQTDQNDANSGIDATSRDFQIPIELDTVYTGTLGNSLSEDGDGFDSYILNTGDISQGYLHIVVTFLEFDTVGAFVMNLWQENYKDNPEIRGDELIEIGTFSRNEIDYYLPLAHPGPIYIQFLEGGSFGGCCWAVNVDLLTYTFSISFIDGALPTQNDAGSGDDAPTLPENAIPVDFGVNYTGNLGVGNLNEYGNPDIYDTYAIDVKETGFLLLNLTMLVDNQIYHHEIYMGNDASGWRQFEATGGLSSFFLAVEPGINYIFLSGKYLDTNIYLSLINGRYSFILQFTTELPESELGGSSTDRVYYGEGYDSYFQPLNTAIQGTLGTSLYDPWMDSYNLEDNIWFTGSIENGTASIELEILESSNDLKSLDLTIYFLNDEECFEDGHSFYLEDIELTMTSTKKLTHTFTLPQPSVCGPRDEPLRGFDIGIGISLADNPSDYVNYQVTFTYPDTSKEVESDIDNPFNELANNPVFIMLLVFTSLTFLGYLKRDRIKAYFLKTPETNGNGINIRITQILLDSFGNKTHSFLLLGQNIIRGKDVSSVEIQGKVPPELFEEKFLLHPVRLAMMKIIVNNPPLTPTELRKHLDISWGDYSTHMKALTERGYISLQEELIDSKFQQVILVNSEGISKYHYVVGLLSKFLDQPDTAEAKADLYPEKK